MENMLHCVFLAFVFIVATPEITGLQCKLRGRGGGQGEIIAKITHEIIIIKKTNE